MSDLISRQAAIAVADGTDYTGLDVADVIKVTDEVVKGLKQLPSAECTGQWIRHFDGNEWYWYCSACKEQWYEEDLYMGGCDFPNYCPNCGARMKGEEDE